MKKIWIYLIFAAFAVVTTTTVILGLYFHQEAGLLKICWVPYKNIERAQYIDGLTKEQKAGCDNPEELRWSQGNKLRVAVTNNNENIIAAAIKIVNSQLKTNLSIVNNVESADIVVTMNAAFEISKNIDVTGDAAGYCLHYHENNKMMAKMVVRPSDTHAQLRIAVHELGHCFGLAHDDYNKSSIMYPMTENRISSRIKTILFSDNDRKIIRELYN
jgi:predicted Zn-dependent protease